MTETPLRASKHAPIFVTVDLVIFTVRQDALQVLLIERGNEPYFGLPALPGGYVREGETLDQAALRELSEETGVDGRRLHLEQLRAYSDPERDPRGRIITVAYLALGPDLPQPVAGTDARAAHWMPVASVVESASLAFDHSVILRDALERARSQLEYTTVAAVFCTEPFTVGDLRHIYEVVWGFSLDPSNFRRKVTHAESFLVPTGGRRYPDVGRPAALYRRGPARLLVPPLLRSGDVTRSSSMPVAPFPLPSV
ncbi:NUDIX domain-containing protein [Sphaerisporangium sp. NPDC051017]|uniref:NUDIX hydrolase n=1 Tax=Sphaerisporangium sp. NPDC051017 TaxID=3154636 RepID=UPI00341A76D2